MTKHMGPKLTVVRSCQGCYYEESDYYTRQGDSGYDVYCTHPTAPQMGRTYVGDSNWNTPDWCPFLQPNEK